MKALPTSSGFDSFGDLARLNAPAGLGVIPTYPKYAPFYFSRWSIIGTSNIQAQFGAGHPAMGTYSAMEPYTSQTAQIIVPSTQYRLPNPPGRARSRRGLSNDTMGGRV